MLGNYNMCKQYPHQIANGDFLHSIFFLTSEVSSLLVTSQHDDK